MVEDSRDPGARVVASATMGQTGPMIGQILIVIALVVVIPVVVFVSGAVISVVLGHLLRMEGEYRNEGSELLELNV